MVIIHAHCSIYFIMSSRWDLMMQYNSFYNYILHQEKHHSKKTFKEEYVDLLKKFNIDYNEKYLFEWIE